MYGKTTYVEYVMAAACGSDLMQDYHENLFFSHIINLRDAVEYFSLGAATSSQARTTCKVNFS
jgi:hypothetical protein